MLILGMQTLLMHVAIEYDSILIIVKYIYVPYYVAYKLIVVVNIKRVITCTYSDPDPLIISNSIYLSCTYTEKGR